jgi:histidinol-phosphate aminotransferase
MLGELVKSSVRQIAEYVPGQSAPGAIKLSSNENPFGPSPKALWAIAKEARSLQAYPDKKAAALCEALAKKFKLAPENIVCGNGSDDLIQVIAAAYLNPGDDVVISEHCFSIYELAARIFSATPVVVEMKDRAQDLDRISSSVSSKTKIIFLTNPNNPTGTIFSAEEFDAFMGKIPAHVIVVVDEAYAEFSESAVFPDTIKYIKSRANLIVLRTFSKFYGLAGLRCGYAIGKGELIAPLFKAKMPFNVNRLAQAGALAALGDRGFLAKTYKNNREGKILLYKEFDKLGLDYQKTEANFIFVDIKRSADSFCRDLLKLGIAVRPLTSFGLPEAIRISIGTRAQNKKLIAAIKKTLG